MSATATHRAIDAVWRIESPRLIASLARFVRDVGLGDDLLRLMFTACHPVLSTEGAWRSRSACSGI